MKDKSIPNIRFLDDISAWQQTFDAIPDIIIVIDNAHKILMVNKAFTRKIGVAKDEVMGKPCYQVIHNTDQMPDYCPHAVTAKTGMEYIAEAHEDYLNGYFIFSATPLFNAAGERIGTVEVMRDISNRKATEDALKDSESVFRSITESATDAIISIDKNDTIVLWNQTAETMFGYSAKEAIGNKLTMLMPGRYKSAHKKGVNKMLSTGKSALVGKSYEVSALRKDGSEFPIELSLSSWERKDDIFFTGIIRDTTERKELEKKLHEASLTDELTGLLNRRGFLTLSEKQLQISRRYKRRFSILFLDLNDMKQINDNFGHSAGDQALRDIADILRKTFRSSDIIARLGGDEFTVLINEPSIDIEALITKNINRNLNMHNDHSENPYRLSTSLGISHFDPSHPKSIEDLLAAADQLMYEHKSRKVESPSEGEGKRKSERISTGNDHFAELLVSDNSTIRNVSHEGICLMTPHILVKDTIYHVKFPVHENTDISLTAVVIWSALMKKHSINDPDQFETGLMFIELDAERNKVLSNFINNLQH